MQPAALLLFAFIGLSTGAPNFGLPKQNGRVSQVEKRNNVEFLGTHNSKNFYIVRDESTQLQAKSGCELLGFELAQIDTQSELDYLRDHISYENDDNSWTAATVEVTLQNPDGTLVNPEITVTGISAEESGLVINMHFEGTDLKAMPTNSLEYFFCTDQSA